MKVRSRGAVFASVTVGLAALLAFTPTVSAKKPPKPPKPPVSIQILGLNDFHGQLEVVNPIASSGGRIGPLTRDVAEPDLRPDPPLCYPAGGVEYLATHVENLRAENPNTVFVSAGDLIGATPLLSALFHDEPTIEAFNLMGLDYNGVGNHEFDEGIDELLRMQYGDRTEHGVRAGAAPTVVIPSTDAATARASAAPTSTSSPPTSRTRTPARRSSRPMRSRMFAAASRSRSSA